MTTTAIPVLRAFDYAKTLEFYIDWLGGTLQWKHAPEAAPFYLEIMLRDVRIHLSEHHGDCTPGGKVLITGFQGLEAYHRELIDKGYRYMKPGLEKTPWDPDALSVTVIDPFMNRIQFTGPRG